jgi:hypothetical protein
VDIERLQLMRLSVPAGSDLNLLFPFLIVLRSTFGCSALHIVNFLMLFALLGLEADHARGATDLVQSLVVMELWNFAQGLPEP